MCGGKNLSRALPILPASHMDQLLMKLSKSCFEAASEVVIICPFDHTGLHSLKWN